MTAFEARAPTTDDPVGPPRRVLVLYDTTAEGGAALAYADTLASAAGAPLTVLVVMPRERDDVGCA